MVHSANFSFDNLGVQFPVSSLAVYDIIILLYDLLILSPLLFSYCATPTWYPILLKQFNIIASLIPTYSQLISIHASDVIPPYIWTRFIVLPS